MNTEYIFRGIKVKEYYGEPCWLHPRLDSRGYSTITLGTFQRYSGHRLAYEVLVGPIPKGIHINHLCKNKACYNPAHLKPVNPSKNKTPIKNCRKCSLPMSGIRKDNGKKFCQNCKNAYNREYCRTKV